MNVYYLDENLKGSFTAGFKAPSDIAAICKKLGFNRIEMPYIRHYKNKILDKIRKQLEEYEQIKAAADAAGLPVNTFIKLAIREKIERDGKG